MRISDKILATISEEGGEACEWEGPHPRKELEQRWGFNANSCGNVLGGLHIRNHEGQSFWELLFLELRAEHADWRLGSCDEILRMLNSDSIIFGLWAEYETGEYFNVHYAYHAQPGEIANRPGFRYMEWPYELLDHMYPYWQSLTVDPDNPAVEPEGYRKHFPGTMAFLDELEAKAAEMLLDTHPYIQSLTDQLAEIGEDDDEMWDNCQLEIISVKQELAAESKRLRDMVSLKKDQLKFGVKQSLDELAKLTEDAYDPFNILLFLLHPVHGAGVLRALLRRAKEGGHDLDKVWEGDTCTDEDMKETGTDWGIDKEYQPSGFEKAVYEKLEGQEEKVAHSLRMHGLCQAKCRDEMKMLSRETQTVRDNDSTTRLKDFHKQYPNIFDCLHSWFARTMSNTRPIEGAHGFQRSSWDPQRTFQRNNAQLAYLMRIEYQFRHARRTSKYSTMDIDETEYKTINKSTVKHCDTTELILMAGSQLNGMVEERYTDSALKERFSLEVLARHTIRNTNKIGMKAKNKMYEAERVEKSKEKQSKRKNDPRYKEKYPEEYVEEAKAIMTEHDRLWADDPKREMARRAGKILTKGWWETVPEEMFMDELERVLPNFYSHVTLMAASKQNREYILRTSKGNEKGDKPTNCLVEYVKAVKQIAKKKRTNDLSPPDEVPAIMNKSTEDILATYVKVDESEHLANTMQDHRDELDLVLALIAENGRTTTDHKRYKLAKKTFKKYNLQYEYNEEESAAAAGNAPFEWWEVADDDEEEEELEEDAEEDDGEEEVVVDDRDDDMEEDTL